jgi:hypothetical protein
MELNGGDKCVIWLALCCYEDFLEMHKLLCDREALSSLFSHIEILKGKFNPAQD